MKNIYVKNIKIHTIEFSMDISYEMYNEYRTFFYTRNERVVNKRSKITYLGLKDRGIQIELYYLDTCYTYRLKYIINLSRFKDSDDYMGLTNINDVSNELEKVEDFLMDFYEMLPSPFDCKVSRIDLTKNIYVGENIKYLIKLLNRCYVPYNIEKFKLKSGKYSKSSATFTKRSKQYDRKIIELSFYNKYKELNSQSQQHSEELMESANGILRMELRLFKPRLKNMTKKYRYTNARELLNLLPDIADDVISKNLKTMLLAGDFYKFEEILHMINNSSYNSNVKGRMTEFIRYAAEHKSAVAAANTMECIYGAHMLKDTIKRFNALGIIPAPIGANQPISQWSFRK